MGKGWTDAEFEVVSAPLRLGDPHPTKRQWLYAGPDTFGRPRWYRPARFTRWQVFLLLCAGVVAFRVAAFVGLWAAHRFHLY